MMPSQISKTVILDTDPGIDDAMALLFLRGSPSVRLAAITTVFGNGDVETTTRNALYLCDRFDIDVPVYQGAGEPLTQARAPAPHHVHGHDALGDLGLTDGFAGVAQKGAAHRAIVDLVRANPHQISILAIGPLTNLALALDADPAISGLVREVVIMGGAFGWGGRRGNVSPVAEANIRNDPTAADRVFGASWPITAVGLDVTSRCVLPTSRAQALVSQGGEAGAFLWDISRTYEALYRLHDGLEGCCLHDVAAAVYLVSPELFTTQSGPIRVVTEGIAVGQTIQKADGQSFPPGPWDVHPSHNVCIEVDEDALLAAYAQALIGSAGGDRASSSISVA